MQKLIPPYLFLLLLIVIGVTAQLCFIRDGALALNPWGFVPFFGGLMLAVIAKKQFRNQKTTVETFDEPNAIVTDGLFRHSRNPMYLGLTISLIGAAMISQCALAFFAPVAFFVVCQFWYIAHEEAVMRAGFGDAYRIYSARTRRWI